MKRTTKCIICLKKATCYTGHVVKEGEPISAGWCREHAEVYLRPWDEPSESLGSLYLGNKMGCYGGWMECYGIEDYKFE